MPLRADVRSFYSAQLPPAPHPQAARAADRRRDRARGGDDLRRPAAGGDDPAHLHRPLRLGLRPDRPGRLGQQSAGSLPPSALRRVQRTEGVEDASAERLRRHSRWSDEDGRVEEGSGSDPERRRGRSGGHATSPTRTTVAGREIRGGREIELEQSWADANGIEVGDGQARRAAGVDRPRGGRACSSSRAASTSAARASPRCRSATARRAFDKPDVCDEVEVLVAGDDEGERRRGPQRARGEFGKGRRGRDPRGEGRGGPEAAPGLQRRPLLLRRHGAVRRRLPDLQQLQHDRAPAHARDRHAAHPRRDAGR